MTNGVELGLRFIWWKYIWIVLTTCRCSKIYSTFIFIQPDILWKSETTLPGGTRAPHAFRVSSLRFISATGRIFSRCFIVCCSMSGAVIPGWSFTQRTANCAGVIPILLGIFANSTPMQTVSTRSRFVGQGGYRAVLQQQTFCNRISWLS